MPPQIINVEDDLNRLLKEKFTNEFRTGYINVKGCCLPEYYNKFADAIENMEIRDDDVWVCSFPKTGTTWTQEMVWCIANNLDFEAAKVPLPDRFPFLDFTPLFDYRTISKEMDMEMSLSTIDSVKYIKKLDSPRYIKTHLPFNLLPRQLRKGEKKPKVIYVTRNPKDACISYYHHCKIIEGYRGDFDEFCSLFLAGKLCFAPFWDHVLGYWNQRDQENFLFLKYEEMKADLPSIIRKTANFLGKKLNDSEIKILENHLSFASMKANPSVNYEEVIQLNKKYKFSDTDGKFMRSGETNQWKGKMNTQIISQFDTKTKEKFKFIDLEL